MLLPNTSSGNTLGKSNEVKSSRYIYIDLLQEREFHGNLSGHQRFVCCLKCFWKTVLWDRKAGLVEDIIPWYVQCQYIVPLDNIPKITIYKDVDFCFMFKRKETTPCCDVLLTKSYNSYLPLFCCLKLQL